MNSLRSALARSTSFDEASFVEALIVSVADAKDGEEDQAPPPPMSKFAQRKWGKALLASELTAESKARALSMHAWLDLTRTRHDRCLIGSWTRKSMRRTPSSTA